jgi:hypothetical protein
LLQENNHSLAKMAWRNTRETLRQGMTEHATRILRDWLHYFCKQANPGKPGYIEAPPEVPDGFVKTEPNTPFNLYVIKQLDRLQTGGFDLVEKVMNVLDRYIELKYEFWSLVLERIERIRMQYNASKNSSSSSSSDSSDSSDSSRFNEWLFVGLPEKPAEERTPTRESVSSYALIRRGNVLTKDQEEVPSDVSEQREDEWLLQWNAKWKKMNLISGHQDPDDPNELTCVMREIHEELFKSLETEKLKQMRSALGGESNYDRSSDHAAWNDPWIASAYRMEDSPIEYVEFSGSAKEWTQYRMTVFEVSLAPSADNPEPIRLFKDDPFYSAKTRTSPKSVNEWVSAEDIEKGFTRLGRPISETVNRIFKECGLLTS